MGRTLICDVCKKPTDEIVGKLELAWAAGFFDGEGGTYVQHNARTRLYLKLIVGQKHRAPLDRMRKAFGGIGNVTQRGQGLYTYQITRQEDVHLALEMMWPYLCDVKREQANAAIDVVNQRGEEIGQNASMRYLQETH